MTRTYNVTYTLKWLFLQYWKLQNYLYKYNIVIRSACLLRPMLQRCFRTPTHHMRIPAFIEGRPAVREQKEMSLSKLFKKEKLFSMSLQKQNIFTSFKAHCEDYRVDFSLAFSNSLERSSDTICVTLSHWMTMLQQTQSFPCPLTSRFLFRMQVLITHKVLC